jgi:adenine deaminase
MSGFHSGTVPLRGWVETENRSRAPYEAVTWSVSVQVVTADVIYTGEIVTVDDARPIAEAVAVANGRLAAVGTRDEVLAQQRGPATRVVDLGGNTLLPAFIDPHSHYINSLTVANQVNVYAPRPVPARTSMPSSKHYENSATPSEFHQASHHGLWL